jgi:hypothetical protein
MDDPAIVQEGFRNGTEVDTLIRAVHGVNPHILVDFGRKTAELPTRIYFLAPPVSELDLAPPGRSRLVRFKAPTLLRKYRLVSSPQERRPASSAQARAPHNLSASESGATCGRNPFGRVDVTNSDKFSIARRNTWLY